MISIFSFMFYRKQNSHWQSNCSIVISLMLITTTYDDHPLHYNGFINFSLTYVDV